LKNAGIGVVVAALILQLPGSKALNDPELDWLSPEWAAWFASPPMNFS
jgi:hypothetical protein